MCYSWLHLFTYQVYVLFGYVCIRARFTAVYGSIGMCDYSGIGTHYNHRYFQHAHFMQIVGVGKRGVY